MPFTGRRLDTGLFFTRTPPYRQNGRRDADGLIGCALAVGGEGLW
jgi:hypothetical protein